MAETITELVPAIPLDGDDRAAFKAADDWSLHLNRHSGSIIVLTARGGYDDNPRVWTVREQHLFPDTPDLQYGSRDRQRTIHVNASAMGYHGSAGGAGFRWDPAYDSIERMPSCFASSPATEIRNTLAETFRNGDVLRLDWIADNNNELTKSADLHVDEVRLVITRIGSKGQPRRLTYPVSFSVCKDNSARMIQRNG